VRAVFGFFYLVLKIYNCGRDNRNRKLTNCKVKNNYTRP